MNLAFFLKTFAMVAPLADALVRVRGGLRQIRAWWVNAEAKVGLLGRSYDLIWKWPVWLLSAVLVVVLLFAVVALLAGLYVMLEVGRAQNAETALKGLRSTNLGTNALAIHDSAWILFGIYVVLALIVAFNAVPRLLTSLIELCSLRWSSLLYLPGYINASWQCKYEDKAVAANISRDACERMGNAMIETIAQRSLEWRARRAEPPVAGALSIYERANLLLIGNTIEGACHQDRRKMGPWGRFYELLVQFGVENGRPFEPKNLRVPAAADALYPALRASAGAEREMFPDSSVIAEQVASAVRLLSANFAGSAADLAGSAKSPSLLRARKRLEPFPQMGPDCAKCMRPQFLRLALRWNVWPSLRKEQLVFTRFGTERVPDKLIRLLLDSECITVSGSGDIPKDDNMKHLAVFAVHAISRRVAALLENSQNAQLSALHKEFSENGADLEWQIFDLTDYFLWQASDTRATKEGDILNPPEKWRVEEHTISEC